MSINTFDINGADINGSGVADFETPILELTYVVPIELRGLQIVWDERTLSQSERRTLRIVNSPYGSSL